MRISQLAAIYASVVVVSAWNRHSVVCLCNFVGKGGFAFIGPEKRTPLPVGRGAVAALGLVTWLHRNQCNADRWRLSRPTRPLQGPVRCQLVPFR